jgi:hypothetical protein
MPYQSFTNVIQELEAEHWIGVVAAVISICAILFSTCQFRENTNRTIEHDKLSVRPLLRFQSHYSNAFPWRGIRVI